MRSGLSFGLGVVLLSAFAASCFVWGPFGLICYVGGRFNSLSVFVFLFPFVLLTPLAVILLPVLAIRTTVRWRELSDRGRVLSSLFIVVLAAIAASFGLGFAGVMPSAFDMFVQGFAKYAESRVDVPATQNWLGTLDPNEYYDEYGDPGGIPFPAAKLPTSIGRLNPKNAKIMTDSARRPMLHLLWGGGMIGHWGILVGDKAIESPPAPDMIGYRSLAAGAWVWYDLD